MPKDEFLWPLFGGAFFLYMCGDVSPANITGLCLKSWDRVCFFSVWVCVSCLLLWLLHAF